MKEGICAQFAEAFKRYIVEEVETGNLATDILGRYVECKVHAVYKQRIDADESGKYGKDILE